VLPPIQDALFEPGSARLAIAVSEVVTKEAAEITQGPGARRLGQQLVLATRTHDASYTCSCPAVALAQMGCRQVIAISPESGPVFTDLFQAVRLPEAHRGVPIRVIQPDHNLSEIGVDYLKATEEGLAAAYGEGRRAGEVFLGGMARVSPG
jgi:hypothetical protein